MKKILSVIGALALILSAASGWAEAVYPVYVWAGTPPTSVTATAKTDGNLMSLEIKDLQEGAFVMEVFMRSSGTVTCVGIVSEDKVDPPEISTGKFHTLDGEWDKKAVFTIANKQPGRYSAGIVTFASTVPWAPGLGEHVMLVKVNATGPTGNDSCWLVAIKPPTACTVTKFYAVEQTNVVSVVTYEYRYNASIKKWIRVQVTKWVEQKQTTIGLGLGNVHDSYGFEVHEQQVDGSYLPVAAMAASAVDTTFTWIPSPTRTGWYVLLDNDTILGPTVVGTTKSIPSPLDVVEPPPPNTN